MSAHTELPEQFGRYRILQKLGQGGMGAVYLAEDKQLGRRVALKVPHFAADEDPEILQRFDREARIAAAIEHVHICRVYDVGQIEGRHYLTMELIDGRPLARLIDAAHPWPPPQAAELVRQLAAAVEVLHHKGAIHRDLKPANIMIRPDGEPVLMDFGLARSLSDQERLTRTGAVVGSPAYMAPEQAQGDPRAIGPGVDLYSLGVILYQLLTGRLPFEGPPVFVFGQILHGQPLPPSVHRPGLDGKLEAICLKAMAKQVEQRYATAAELAAALQHYLASAGPPPPARNPVSPSNRVSDPQADAPRSPEGAPTLPPPEEGRIPCPNCGQPLRIPLRSAGQPVQCPKCQVHFRVPAPLSPLPETLLAPSAARKPLASRKRVATLLGVVLLGLLLGGLLLGRRGTPLEDTPAPSPPVSHPPPGPLPAVFTNSIGMRFVLVPKGKSWLGGGGGKPGTKPVEITRDFYLGAFEVTQAEWEAIMGGGKNPSYFSRRGAGKDAVKDIPEPELQRFPVEQVSWEDAQQFIQKLNAREKYGNGEWLYRLPTEAEWEYACRGGATSPEESSYDFYFDKPTNDLSSAQANFQGDQPSGKAPKGPSLGRTCRVGSYKPNRLGLHDMHGNVWEWCEDVDDKGLDRVGRGGCGGDVGSNCRAAGRWNALAYRDRYLSFRDRYLGFRLARVPSGG